MSWYKDYQVTISSLIEFKEGKYGYSGYAKNNIIQNGTTELLSIPYKYILTEDYSINNSILGKYIWYELQLQKQYPIEITPRIIMYLVMIYERGYIIKNNNHNNHNNNINNNDNNDNDNNHISIINTTIINNDISPNLPFTKYLYNGINSYIIRIEKYIHKSLFY